MMELAVALVLLLAFLEWYFNFDFSLGIFYIFPVIVAAMVLKRWQVLVAAISCALVRGLFTPNETALEHTLRFCMATIAYTGCGLLVYQINFSQRLMLQHYARIRMEQKLRQKAEQQLRLLAESSPAAILTVGSSGEIIAANHAACTMFGVEEGSLISHPVRNYLPLLSDALALNPEIEHIRTSATTWARRSDGSVFPAATWFSIYGAREQRNLAAIVVDYSEEVRDRERSHFEQMVNYNRVLAGAVSHEIRNLCSAIAVVTSNLERRSPMVGDADFQALKSLVAGLSKLASFDLRTHARKTIAQVSVAALFDELHVIISQDWEDIGGVIHWQIHPDLTSIAADRSDLLQVLLNLAQNALRAVEDAPQRELTIEVSERDRQSVIQVRDSGVGVPNTELLFQPFHPGSEGAGLGLYVSRAIIRSFGGELHYLPVTTGCCFEIVIPFSSAMVVNQS
ncbi:PAS domain-containing sensor histidine kinase [Granulicella sp. dw_53]|uniref:sensor histidine kinase n=1 Tax=Granulicella sp. dw_53 TaxID=2719792 RepID=UPI001BD38515|nr:PAS domain-containing sensor histidine kinase [Granulicella sp. dw_53]